MKKFFFVAIAALSAAFMVASCQNNLEPESEEQGLKQITITVTTPDSDSVKGSLDGKSVLWAEGETVAVYDGVSETPRQFTVVSVGGGEATISGAIDETSTSLAAVYPFSAASGFADGKFSVAVPGAQVIPAGKSIDPSAIVSVATAEVGEDLLFKNVVSLIKFTVGVEGVKSVVFKGNASEKFFGAASVDPATMEIAGATMASGTVSAAEGSTFVKDAVYYATCLPCAFATGMNVCTNLADKKYFKSSEKENEFVRNAGLNLGDIASGDELPMLITNKEELDAWAAHATCYLDGETVKLGADIDYGGAQWKSLPDYAANFDGQGYSIYNINIVINPAGESSCQGFFSVLRHNSTIKDLSLGMDPATGAYDGTSTNNIVNAQYSGGLAALVKPSNSTETVTVSGVKNYIPLIRQSSATLAEGLRIGGIIGAISENNAKATTFTDCTNYGAINNLSTVQNTAASYYGGILGYAAGAETVITGCGNEGAICLNGKGKITKASFAGGILGRLSDAGNCTITNCTNKGKIYTEINVSGAVPYLGGIVGADKTTTNAFSVKITNCTNEGLISAYNQSSGTIAGGIIALLQAPTMVENCINKGEVYKVGNHGSTTILGGIVGKTEAIDGAYIKNCSNSGKVYEAVQTSAKIIVFGGIAGTCQIPVIGCTNTGNIVAEGNKDGMSEYLGGIAGMHCATDKSGGSSVIEGCTANCTLKATGTLGNFGIGGLVGIQGNAGCTTGEGCSLNCTIKATDAATLGPVCGLVVGTYATATTATTFGSASDKMKVKGSVCGTAVDASNLATMLEGSATANAAHVFNVELQ